MKQKFPKLFDCWEEHKLNALGFREGDIDVIHELFERNLLHTGITILLAFTHGDCYPMSSMEQIFNVGVEDMLKSLAELVQRRVVYSEKFIHPIRGWNFYYADRDLLLALVRDRKLESARLKIKSIHQSEEPLLVFVSSVMNKDLENLEAERHMARAGVEDLRFTRPWLFEEAPASSESLPDQFLERIKKSDFFIQVLGSHITDIVELEYRTAQSSGVNCLVFLKAGVKRSDRTKKFVKTINIKYKEFWNPNDLRGQVTMSLTDEIVRLAREGALRQKVNPRK